MGLVGADLAELRDLVVRLDGPLRADLDGVLTAMNSKVQASSGYWVAADGDKFRADFAGYIRKTMTDLDGVLEQAARVAGQNLAAIEQATEAQDLAYYWNPARLIPDFGNLIPDSVAHLTSDEEGAIYFGTSSYLFSKYGIGYRIMLPGSPQTPWPAVPRTDDLSPGDEITELGERWVSNKGIFVPAGSSLDPRLPPPPDDLGAGWKTGVDAGLRFDPVNVPTWAKVGSKALFVVGAGLTLYSQWDETWREDQALHPNWSTGERIADAAGQTAVMGGATVAGAWAGAEAGAEGGAMLGAAMGSVFPGPGTVVGGVVGGLVGGVVGGFVGSEVGRAVGHAVWDGGKEAVQGAEHVGTAAVHGVEDVGKTIWHGLGL